jgi:ankyrin repeat protein
MPANSEAIRLNIEYHRKQAKALLKAAQSGDPAALQRLPEAPKLHDAQLAIAREQGFPSWPRLRAFVVQSGGDISSKVEAFLDAALSDRRRAEELLAATPAIADAGFHVALVLGDVGRVERALAAAQGNAPALAIHPGGPLNYEPLIYVCFSRFARGGTPRAAKLVESARLLLRHGANPNTALNLDDLPGNPLSCLYGATGLNNNPALGVALLEGGANPNDGESLYHSTEHADLECVKLLVRHGAKPAGTNALKHMLDREDMEGLQLLLHAGADPDEKNGRGETALHWAVWRGRSPSVVAALVDSGANLNIARNDGRTPYALAVQSGQRETAALLEARGANTTLLPIDRFLDACALADPGELDRLLAAHPRIDAAAFEERLLPDLAESHRTAAVRALLAAGAPVNAFGGGSTALHWACWKGYADLVEVLLRHGASLTIEDSQYHAPPAGWFTHGLHNCGETGGHYPAVARLLIAAGAVFPKGDLPTGNSEVDAVLREHGFI